MRVAFVTLEYPPFIIDSAGICSSHIEEEFADENALANAINAVLDDKSMRDEMAENAYIFMKDNLSWMTVAKRTYSVYHEVISHGKSSSKV